MMKQKQILALYEECRQTGMSALKSASDYLHEHCCEWNEEHERKYTEMVNASAIACAQAEVLSKVMEG